MRTNRGFTLLEVVIAMMILSFISLFTVEAINKALSTKAKVQKDIDKTSTLRDALRIIERDINLAFNYRDVSIALYNMTQKERQKNATTKQPPAAPAPGQPATATGQPPATPPAAPIDPAAAAEKYKLKTEKVYTQFIGEAHSLVFTTLSNARMMEESSISTQAEVAYTLKSCRRRSNQEQSSQCLWRRVANYLHDDITHEDGQSTVILENVTEFKLRYLGPGKEDEWVDTWITNERGDANTQGKFPYGVEITIEVKDPSPAAKDKPLRMTTVAAIRNPNNPVASKDGANPNDPNNPANLNNANGINPLTGQPNPTVPSPPTNPVTTPGANPISH